MRFWTIGVIVSFCVIVLLLSLSKNGLRDWIRMDRQMNTVREDIRVVENSNRGLRMRLDLIEADKKASLENYMRSTLGWVRKDEKLYLEPN